MKYQTLLLAAALSALSPWTFAANETAAATTAAAAAFTDGEIKKIDLEQGKVTLKHGAIENLGMPGMTMVFRADPAILTNFKVGDAVKFRADRLDGSIQVTELVGR